MLADALKLDRFALVGHSLATPPDRVSQLILVNSAGRRLASYDGGRGWHACRWSAISPSISPPPVVGAPVAELISMPIPAMVTTESVQHTGELQRFPGNHEAVLQRARTQPRLHLAPPKRLDVPIL
jgi:pimeloyl-ACP methyl ester carboxylesterase